MRGFPASGGGLRGVLTGVCIALLAAGCTYNSSGPVEQHFQDFATRPPQKNRITVCSAYGCKAQTDFRFTAADITHLQKLMRPGKAPPTPAQERKLISDTLAWMEKRVGDVVGTSADRPGDDLAGGGDPTQMDCVDVATNLTSYMLVLQTNGLIKSHTVGPIVIKEDLTRGFDGWPHYAAVLVEHGTRQRFAVDGWKLASGIAPEIVEVERWYIPDATVSMRN